MKSQPAAPAENAARTAAACELCGGSAVRPFFSGRDPDGLSPDPFHLLRCDACGLVFVGNRPSPAELGRYYFKEYYKRPAKSLEGPVRFFGEMFQRYRAGKIAPWKKGGRLLDIGCGEGSFLARMNKHGWETWGVETSREGSQMARQKTGLRVYDRPLADCRLPEAYFDAVTLWQSLEHMTDPAGVLREVRRVLKEDGLLFIAVPNIGGWEFRMFGGRWFHLDLPRHLTHYTPETIGRLLRVCGFRVERISHFSWEYNPFGFFQSVLNEVPGEMNFLYNFLKGVRTAQSEDRWNTTLGLLAAALSAPGIVPLAFAYSLVSGFFGRAGCMEVWASKDKA